MLWTIDLQGRVLAVAVVHGGLHHHGRVVVHSRHQRWPSGRHHERVGCLDRNKNVEQTLYTADRLPSIASSSVCILLDYEMSLTAGRVVPTSLTQGAWSDRVRNWVASRQSTTSSFAAD